MTTPARPQNASDARQPAPPAGHGAKSDALRQRAILELLTGRTFGAAAKKIGVHERTLRKWVAEDAEFRRELKQAEHAMFQAGMDRILGLTARAVDTLGALMDPSEPATVRLGAARTVVELGLHRHESETIHQKLAELERHQRDQPGRNT